MKYSKGIKYWIPWSVVGILRVYEKKFYADGFSIGLGIYIVCFQAGMPLLRSERHLIKIILYLSQHQI